MNFSSFNPSAIGAAVAIAVAVAIGSAIEGGGATVAIGVAAAVAVAIAGSVPAVVLRATDFILRQVVAVIVQAYGRDGVVGITRSTDSVVLTAVGAIVKPQTPCPPVHIGGNPVGVACAIAIGQIAIAVAGPIVVVLARAPHLSDVLAVSHLVARVASIVTRHAAFEERPIGHGEGSGHGPTGLVQLAIDFSLQGIIQPRLGDARNRHDFS
ncbi:hypothetical protein [Polynucleobacter sp. MWH-Aus1W21]|uniref:hypothetical protein n=1 Tax=Polynucleobacter sp. MWH-Aus1W21 TaxID=1855880 RepID=UPI001BFD425F|nr:hypothetical protein [Polynucleobacter sp. MWH-Aus1W21]QWD65967.1 hypothetical protein ICW03_10015 [Polynucleobacter sp. MWH-Aus1W21]